MTPIDNETNSQFYLQAQAAFGTLLLPPCDLKLRQSATLKAFDVYDSIRRLWIALTPEEWVRQHFVTYMIESLGFSPLRIANEVSLLFHGMSRRADTVVYSDTLQPRIIVEYKNPSVPLSAEVLTQALRYNLVFHAQAVMITNGIDIYSFYDQKLFRGPVHSSQIPALR